VLCFAVAAGLGVVGLMRQSHGVPSAAMDDGAFAERLQALEKRLADAELELQARTAPTAAELRTWGDRIVRLEHQVGAIEQRVTAAARRDERPRSAPAPAPRKAAAPAAWTPLAAPAPATQPTPAATATAATATPPTATPPTVAPAPTAVIPEPAPAAPPPPSASPRLVSPTVASPEASGSHPAAPRAPLTASTPPIPPESHATRGERPARVERAASVHRSAEDLPLREKLRRDWDEIKREARRGGDDWREAWDQLKRLFRP
jgi:hypothetical protein